MIDIKRKIREGKTGYEITDWIRNNHDISKASISFILEEAKDLISRENDFYYRDIAISHAGRYEEIWKKNYSNPFSKKLDNPDKDLSDKDVRKTLYKIRNHYMTASDALRAKEKMLGITSGKIDIDVNTQVVEKKDDFDMSNFDLSKLTLSEKIEFLHLLKKAKKGEQPSTDSVITTVTTSVSKDVDKKYDMVINQFDIEDTDYEEIKEEKSGVPLVNSINENLIRKEAKKIDDSIQKTKEEAKKQDFELAKKAIIERFKEKK